jgi:hypothetical protein
MNARDIVHWCLTGLFALSAAGGWAFYHGECRARAEERARWQATIERLQSHAMHGMMLEAQKAREQAQAAEKRTSH